MEKGIIDTIQEQMSTLGKSQRSVADFIMREPIQSAFLTIDKIAHASNVSTATVIRFAQSLGYDTFAAFQNEIRQNIQSRFSPLEKIALMDLKENSETVFLSNGGSAFKEITSVLMNNLQKTLQNLSFDVVNKIADEIVKANHVYVSGRRGTEHLARYLSYHLDRMFNKVDFLPPEINHLPEILQRISSNDLLIISTVYRYSSTAVQTAKLAKQKGTSIVAISDSPESPLAPYADYMLTTFCETRDFHNSGLSMIYLADVIIDTCYKRVKDEVRQKLKDVEYYISELNVKV